MTILDQLPFFDEDTLAALPDGTSVIVRKFQIVAWVSLAPKGLAALPPGTPRFPAILDTGHNHNFSIRHEHLARCLVPNGEALRELPPDAIINGQRVAHFTANVWLHPNRRGQRDVVSQRKPVCLELAGGAAIFAPGTGGPRLPLVGLRALVTNRLVFTVHGTRMHVSLKRKTS
jgi:hypothetical protein